MRGVTDVLCQVEWESAPSVWPIASPTRTSACALMTAAIEGILESSGVHTDFGLFVICERCVAKFGLIGGRWCFRTSASCCDAAYATVPDKSVGYRYHGACAPVESRSSSAGKCNQEVGNGESKNPS